MPLLDHFHLPLSVSRGWSSFFAGWAVAIADSLNARLPFPRYLTEIAVATGWEFMKDVAEREESPLASIEREIGSGVVRTAVISFPEQVAVQVYDFRDGKTLAGVIELVCPGNKEKSDTRQAFVTRCAALLHDRIGLVVADIVTSSAANLHNKLMGRLCAADPADLPEDCHLYTVAYRPVLRKEQSQFDLWPVKLTLGQPLPVLPLALRGSLTVPVDLEATYTEARQRCHL